MSGIVLKEEGTVPAHHSPGLLKNKQTNTMCYRGGAGGGRRHQEKSSVMGARGMVVQEVLP